MIRFLAWVLHTLGATRFASWWHRKDVIILNYHGINEIDKDSHAPKLLDLSVSPESFRSQMACLRSRYNVISLREFLKAKAETTKLPDYSVVLTFDDGYKDFLTVAPLLLQYKMPATLFLVTDMIQPESSGPSQNHADRLSWAEVESLDQHGIFDFGSHTCSHPSLTDLSPAAIDIELRESLNELRRRVKNVMPALAYPNGAHTGISIDHVAAAGYVCALTIDAGANNLGTNPYYLHRQTIRGQDDKQMFAVRLSCLTPWLYGLRKRKNAFFRTRAVMPVAASFEDDRAAAEVE